MSNVNHEKLNELGIFELRNLARSLGVKSPTTLRRNELISEIEMVFSGKKPRYVRTTRQGRPPKTLSNSTELMNNIIIPIEYDREQHNFINQKFILNDSGVENIGIQKESTLFKSIIKLSPDETYGFAFRKGFNEIKNNLILINQNQIEQYKLKDGDEISGTYILTTMGSYVVSEILSLNGMAFNENIVRNDFEQMCATTPNKHMKLSIYKNDEQIFADIDSFSTLCKGQRVLMICNNENNLNVEILSRLSSSKQANILVLMIDECPEYYFELLSKYNLEILSNNYNISNENFDLKLSCKLQNIIRNIENGDDYIIFVNDIIKFYSYLVNANILLNQTHEQAKINAENYLKKLILLGKNCAKSSLTIICATDETTINSSPEYSNSVFKNLFNNIIVYKNVKKEYFISKELCTIKNKKNAN